MRVSQRKPFSLDSGREQFLSALSFYAALGVERVQLVAEAERAEAFRQADTLKSALIASVSHDLRTPLTTIKALAHSLGEAGSPEALAIEEEADRLNRLVADLLDLSRLNAGAMPLRPEINAAEDLIGAALRRVAGAIDPKRIRVVAAGALGDGDADLVLLGRFDFVQSPRAREPDRMRTKYSPSGESIEQSVGRSDQHIYIRVADRGPGVDEQELGRIFEPFYRGQAWHRTSAVPGSVSPLPGGSPRSRAARAVRGACWRRGVFTLTLPRPTPDAPNDTAVEHPG